MGGFLNTWEYKVTANSSFSNTSYLAPGIGYWLVSNGKPYNYLDIKLEKTSDELLLETKVCEFVKKNAIVDGKGTYGDPWTFKKGHLITVASNSLLYGKTSPSVIEYVNTDDVSEIAVIPNANYHYDDSDCVNNSKDVASYSIKNNVITIKNVIDDVKCTINFIPNEYKITLNQNGGSGGTGAIYEKYHTSFSLSSDGVSVSKINIPTRTNYTFLGYYTATSGGTQLIDSSGNFTSNLKNTLFTSNSTIYAQWKLNTYTITFNSNGGSGSMSNLSCLFDSNCTLTGNKFSKSNYAFIGWSEASNGSVKYTDGATAVNIAPSGSKTLYAVWTLAVYNFDYTGAVQTFTAPSTGYYKLEVWGAQGGTFKNQSPTARRGGYGGYSVGVIKLNANAKLYVYVGGRGKDYTVALNKRVGGYNGGGTDTVGKNVSGVGINYSGSGGGATHIATTNRGELKNYNSYRGEVVIVAGGGGGGGGGTNADRNDHSLGGSGGGYIGGYANEEPAGDASGDLSSWYCWGYGGTQSQSYTVAHCNSDAGFGKGGTCNHWGGAGGGGWYGGSAASHNGGGGGSGYIGNSSLISYGSVTKHMSCWNCPTSSTASTKTNKVTNTSKNATADYAKLDNGYARITYIGS